MLRSRSFAFLAMPPLLLGAVALMPTEGIADSSCNNHAATTFQTKCVTAVQIPGNALLSYDISWVNPKRAEMYFADRSNSAVEVIDTVTLQWKRRLGGFVGAVLNSKGAVNNAVSGPDGVVSHGRWLYAGDGDSTLKVFDLDAPPAHALKATIPTGGSTRVDEMALTSNGRLLLAANNAEDPPFATLFRANGDEDKDHTTKITKISVDPSIIPAGAGLSLEQPTWDPRTKRFYTSIPIIKGNPNATCNFDANAGPVTCDGGVLVTDPDRLTAPTAVEGAFDPKTNTGVVALHACGPNGASTGSHDNIIFGCTPQNNPSDVITLVMNAVSKNQTPVAGITGSDEVWFNAGDNRYYTASNRDCKTFAAPCGSAPLQKAVLGVIDGDSLLLLEGVPQSSGSHSVAADSDRNLIFVPQSAPNVVTNGVSNGGDTTNVGAGLCGGNNGCVAVFKHNVKPRHDDDDDGDVAENHEH